jgi:magnesium transporter
MEYPAESAGRLVVDKVIRLKPEMAVAEALESVREQEPEVETIVSGYVLDDGGHLVGIVSLRNLIADPPDRQLSEVMTTDVISVQAGDDRELVARLLSKYDLPAIPVVETDRTFLGIVTIDDVIDVLVEEQTEDVLHVGGVESGPLESEPYFRLTLGHVVRSRVTWLMLLFVAETLTGSVMRHFEGDLKKVVALSFFIPLLIGTGGNAGSQSVMTIIRSLALGEIAFSDALRCVIRESTAGIVMGFLIGVVAYFRAVLWGYGHPLALCVAVSIMVICAWANAVGALVPLLAVRLGIDPTVSSAPFIATLVDATGVYIYFSIARLMLGL